MTEVKVTDNSAIFKNAKDKAIEVALEAIGMTAERHAAELTPVDTGRLRASISHAVDADEKAAYIGTNVEYAIYVELKDSKHKVGQAHFLRDAAANHADEYKRIAETYLKNA